MFLMYTSKTDESTAESNRRIHIASYNLFLQYHYHRLLIRLNLGTSEIKIRIAKNQIWWSSNRMRGPYFLNCCIANHSFSSRYFGVPGPGTINYLTSKTYRDLTTFVNRCFVLQIISKISRFYFKFKIQ